MGSKVCSPLTKKGSVSISVNHYRSIHKVKMKYWNAHLKAKSCQLSQKSFNDVNVVGKTSCHDLLLISIWMWTNYFRGWLLKVHNFFQILFLIGWQISIDVLIPCLLLINPCQPGLPGSWWASLFWNRRFRLIPSPAPYVVVFFGRRGGLAVMFFFPLLSIPVIKRQSWVVGESWHITFSFQELCFMCHKITNFVHHRF